MDSSDTALSSLSSPLIIIIIIIIKSLFNTHKKELCTVLHLKGIKTKFVPYHLLERKDHNVSIFLEI